MDNRPLENGHQALGGVGDGGVGEAAAVEKGELCFAAVGYVVGTGIGAGGNQAAHLGEAGDVFHCTV